MLQVYALPRRHPVMGKAVLLDSSIWTDMVIGVDGKRQDKFDRVQLR